VPVKLGGGNAPKELALLLMALMLDPRAGGSAAGHGLVQDALSWLLAAASDVEWRRLQGQLLEALAPPGIGPSNRWGALRVCYVSAAWGLVCVSRRHLGGGIAVCHAAWCMGSCWRRWRHLALTRLTGG
jgi:hypothetical protein